MEEKKKEKTKRRKRKKERTKIKKREEGRGGQKGGEIFEISAKGQPMKRKNIHNPPQCLVCFR
jgi:hypothetical protein